MTPPLKQLLEYLDGSRSFQRVQDLLREAAEKKAAADLRLGNLYGSAKSFVAAGLFCASPRPLLLVTKGARQAEKIEGDLANFLPEESVALCPQWEVLPYEESAADHGVVGRRIEILSDLLHRRPRITVIPVRSLMQKVVPPEKFCEKVITLHQGDPVDLDELVRDLVGLGFTREAMVEEVGTFSLRGGILDIYGYQMDNPVRLELYGDEIAEMRTFEISSQRSLAELGQAVVLPVVEPFLWRCPPELKRGAGLVDVFEYLDDDTLLLFDEYETVAEEAGRFFREVISYHEQAVNRHGPMFHAPDELFISPERLEAWFGSFSRADLTSLHRKSGGAAEGKAVRFSTREPPSINRNLELLRGQLRRDAGKDRASYILCDTPGQLDRLEELLEDLADLVRLNPGNLETGFIFQETGLVVYTDHEIFRRFRHLRTRRKYQRAVALENFTSLRQGDYVVHIDYGVGRFLGLKKIRTENQEVECLWLEYADGDFLYVPVDQLSLVERFSSEDGSPPVIHRIGGHQWARMKARTLKAIEDMSKELIETYAARKIQGGFAFSPDTDWQRDLENSFVYEETPDQLRAIEEIKRDMLSQSCTDRLLCGDVGYGKTEVALRAAFKAVQDGKQVAILVPTTVLAQQHYITFTQRLADFPVAVETLSRFKTPGQQKSVLKKLADGTMDIVIGTHRLLSRDVKFKDLGLLIIDEEQRFGVRHKEKLKSLKKEVDVLAMTATPIPRTLHMSLMGVRDLSIINTPPQDRLPILTQVCAFNEQVIEEAISRELSRDGQVFFVHNRIGSIYAMLDLVRRLAPGPRIQVAHGQMPERELELVMRRFQEREVDVLLSTMIIENGLDFPNANTIIVNRADRFGLSQLYQLRGRVGRSYHRAYAYLLVPPRRLITDEAVKRLRILEEYTELGSGYEIAMRDLEMRGTGNLLGSQQHGFINAVGFDTYLKLLEEAISKLKEEQPSASYAPAKITLDLPAFLPDRYLPDQKQKLHFYRKISQISEPARLDDLAEELADRYGPLPEEARGLLDKARLKILATGLGLEAVFISKSYCKLDFGRDLEYRLAPITEALESVAGEKRVVSVAPPSVVIKPHSLDQALPQIIEAVSRMSAQADLILDHASTEQKKLHLSLNS